MKKFWATLMFSVFALLTLFMTSGIAEDRQGAFTVTPNIGWYFFEGNQNLDDGITSGINLGYSITKNWAVEGSINYIDSDRKDFKDSEVSGYLYKLDALYNITSFGKLVPYLAVGVGGITLDPSRGSSENDFLFNYGAGLKYFLTDDIALRGDVRHVLPYGSLGKDESQNNLLCTVGVSFLFGGEKEKPKVEETPKAEEPPKAVEEPAQVEEQPKEEEPPKAVEPPRTDSDGDGVYDDLDKCPNTPKGATVDSRGCWILEGVYFDTEKWNIVSQYFPILDNVVGIIKKNPDMKLEVQGHTDIRGTEKYNQKLSENRAKSVLEYIAGKGIDREKLTAKGFGYSVPAAPNDTAEGMSKNRRVELKPIY